jgi:FAD/FMN-containing dehydrogenase
MTRYDTTALKARLSHLKIEDNPALVQQKSRDFYWYSPPLKRQLAHVTADAIVSVTSEQDVIDTLTACFDLGIPVTPRAAGTGNYGQAMPLSGGVVLDLSGFDKVKSVRNGILVCEPGAIMEKIDHQTRAMPNPQEIRLHPSTYATASLGGFIAGGSGGAGSIKWGGLRDWGNVIRLRVVTMEKTPRVLELTGADLHKVCHAYGTNGIITEVEVPLAPAYEWIDVIVGFDDLTRAAESPIW